MSGRVRPAHAAGSNVCAPRATAHQHEPQPWLTLQEGVAVLRGGHALQRRAGAREDARQRRQRLRQAHRRLRVCVCVLREHAGVTGSAARAALRPHHLLLLRGHASGKEGQHLLQLLALARAAPRVEDKHLRPADVSAASGLRAHALRAHAPAT
jgi:hypothetical protein